MDGMPVGRGVKREGWGRLDRHGFRPNPGCLGALLLPCC